MLTLVLCPYKRADGHKGSLNARLLSEKSGVFLRAFVHARARLPHNNRIPRRHNYQEKIRSCFLLIPSRNQGTDGTNFLQR
jgi:hypothetical protein